MVITIPQYWRTHRKTHATMKKMSPSSKMSLTIFDLSLIGVPVIPSFIAVKHRTVKSKHME